MNDAGTGSDLPANVMNYIASEADLRLHWSAIAGLLFASRDSLADAADFHFDYAVVTWPHRVSATFSAERAPRGTDYLYIAATRAGEDEDWKVVQRLLPAQP